MNLKALILKSLRPLCIVLTLLRTIFLYNAQYLSTDYILNQHI
jgi:hypothetical protein